MRRKFEDKKSKNNDCCPIGKYLFYTECVTNLD